MEVRRLFFTNVLRKRTVRETVACLSRGALNEAPSGDGRRGSIEALPYPKKGTISEMALPAVSRATEGDLLRRRGRVHRCHIALAAICSGRGIRRLEEIGLSAGGVLHLCKLRDHEAGCLIIPTRSRQY